MRHAKDTAFTADMHDDMSLTAETRHLRIKRVLFELSGFAIRTHVGFEPVCSLFFYDQCDRALIPGTNTTRTAFAVCLLYNALSSVTAAAWRYLNYFGMCRNIRWSFSKILLCNAGWEGHRT